MLAMSAQRCRRSPPIRYRSRRRARRGSSCGLIGQRQIDELEVGVGQAGAHVDQVANGRLWGHRGLWQVRHHRIIEAQPTFLDQLHDDDRFDREAVADEDSESGVTRSPLTSRIPAAAAEVTPSRTVTTTAPPGTSPTKSVSAACRSKAVVSSTSDAATGRYGRREQQRCRAAEREPPARRHQSRHLPPRAVTSSTPSRWSRVLPHRARVDPTRPGSGPGPPAGRLAPATSRGPAAAGRDGMVEATQT